MATPVGHTCGIGHFCCDAVCRAGCRGPATVARFVADDVGPRQAQREPTDAHQALFFASNAINPITLMPTVLQWFTRSNPLSYQIDILRTPWCPAAPAHSGYRSTSPC